MKGTIIPLEIVKEYVQADRATSVGQFSAFLRALKSIAERDGLTAAVPWAARAMSPHLDYSSALKLSRWLVPTKVAGRGDNCLRIAILGGPTTIQLVQLIEAFLVAEGIASEILETEYGVFRQEILSPGSSLDKFRPQIVFLATGAVDISHFPHPGMADNAVIELANAEIAQWQALWESANGRWGATVIQNTFEILPGSVFGHFASRHFAARENYISRLNRGLTESAPSFVVLHDLCSLSSEAGRSRWFDSRLYFEAKIPCAADCIVTYAHSVVSLLRAIVGKSKKVLVLDLDNTIWGGQVGDAGPNGITLGLGSAEGEAYLSFQTYVKALHDRGILLAVCSKNDELKAREPFLVRDDIVLKESDISCFIANWRNKAENLQEIAARLNLGLDSFVFFDDNPAERALVRLHLPMVAVPDVPQDPSDYIGALNLHRFFETVSFTVEDAARTQYYSQDASRREMLHQAIDLDSFLRSLKMRARVEPIIEANLERASQLINKSNQFNLTTRRYAIAELQDLGQRPGWHAITISLRDQLGDSGLICVLLLHQEADTVEIDTWVMSCRVLQRGVERLAFNEAVRIARENGAKKVRGIYIPTSKNAMVQNHYSNLGFRADGDEGQTKFWAMDSLESLLPLSTQIELEQK